ncbi:hypothetical protein FN846DRAFT_960138 [Sphaerosporella brunnea]|uniref:F-box domain-containing protein n=1 Tax=Sphaerosporella brunnea TaxID=1250544 RepID=A0A5J5EQK6_9PEZI|nr:hypothetical protein FN846DRAFT_960138 [Sphaerosporella brunnea]
MSAADLTSVTFGDVYPHHDDASDDAPGEETTLGLQRLSLLGGAKASSALSKEGSSTTPLPMPKLEGNNRRRPLNLIELPIDVLKDIVKEVTHTNDLTNLCLTCRCLHSLAVGQIYSRFDIVWPDAAATGDRVGVDALTHGLATLTNVTRRGNDHARWVKKFSLGNGPPEWVNEYNINKEGGKMLGTLVNLAITRMESLETFSWDMPTGILRDVFMTLHDLNGKLKNVHVRFHDNRETTPPSSQDPSRRVETPTFKGFKGLRSLSVLDIDERQYVEEMSHAIEESADKLKELRVGLAEHISQDRWVRDWEELELASTHSTSEKRGGVLGLLFGRTVNLEEGRRRRCSHRPETLGTEIANAAVETAEAVVVASGATVVPVNMTDGSDDANTAADSQVTLPAGNINVETEDAALSLDGSFVEVPSPTITSTSSAPPVLTSPNPPTIPGQVPVSETKTLKTNELEAESKASRQLKLETLALERVPISVSILVNTKAIDWTVLSNLTIVNCFNHDRLFKALRRKFSPYPAPTQNSLSLPSSPLPGKHSHLHNSSSHRAKSLVQPVPSAGDYKIRLKKLHTDCITPVLIAFIRDTLPPNSLEILFLQETNHDSTVTMENIYRGAIRRHKGSLKKLLVESKHQDDLPPGTPLKWTFSMEHLAFISSGKMPNLRELGMSLEYQHFHYFLTRLPHMPQLRSLYLTRIRDPPHISTQVPKELANQILNTVILRPEIELCYVGILNKCYEILEGRSDDREPGDSENNAPATGSVPPIVEPQDSEDEEESDGDDEDDDDDDMMDDDDVGDDGESDAGHGDEERLKSGIRLREILFYDDKVEIFRARNSGL